MRGDWNIKVTTISSTKSFLIYLTFFMIAAMIFIILKLVILGLILSSLITGFCYWYQIRNNPGALKYYLEYVFIPNELSGNHCSSEVIIHASDKKSIS